MNNLLGGKIETEKGMLLNFPYTTYEKTSMIPIEKPSLIDSDYDIYKLMFGGVVDDVQEHYKMFGKIYKNIITQNDKDNIILIKELGLPKIPIRKEDNTLIIGDMVFVSEPNLNTNYEDKK